MIESKGAPATVGAALRMARAHGVDALDAQLLLARLLERPRVWLIAHDDAKLSAARQAAFKHWLARRAAGEPLAYLLGEKEFHGLLLKVDRRVLVPRPDTEALVDWAIELLAGELATRAAPAVVDLGTGSGAIALAVRQARPTARLTATDRSDDALASARANAERLGCGDGIQWAAGDWWDAVPGRKFDLALSNPPYIAQADPHLAALAHEPADALISGADGLTDLRRIVDGATPHLHGGAWLLLEHGWQQADAVTALLHRHDFEAVETRVDLAGRPRCSGGRGVR